MKKLNIIKSNTEPDKNNLWLKDGEIKEFNGGWKSISSGTAIAKTGMQVFETLEEAQAGDVKDGEIISTYKPSTKRQIDVSEVVMLRTENDGVTYVSGDIISNMSEFYVDYVSSFSDRTSIRFKNGKNYISIILNPQNPFKVAFTISGRDEDLIFDVPGARPWVFPEEVAIDNSQDTYLIGIQQGNISIQVSDFYTGLSQDQINLLNDIKKLNWSVTVGEDQSMALYKKVNSEFKKFTLDSFFPITWDLTTYIRSDGSKYTTADLFHRCMYEGTKSVVIKAIPEEFEYIQGVYIGFNENRYYCPVIDRALKLEDVTRYPKRITFQCPAIVDAYDNHSSIEPLNGNFYITIIQASNYDYPVLTIGRDINPTQPDIVFYAHESQADKNIAMSNILVPDKNYVCAIVGNNAQGKVYNIVGNYYNGVITAFTEGKIKKYEMSSSTGYITEISTFNVNTDPYTSYVEAGGSKTESEFYAALKTLIDA